MPAPTYSSSKVTWRTQLGRLIRTKNPPIAPNTRLTGPRGLLSAPDFCFFAFLPGADLLGCGAASPRAAWSGASGVARATAVFAAAADEAAADRSWSCVIG